MYLDNLSFMLLESAWASVSFSPVAPYLVYQNHSVLFPCLVCCFYNLLPPLHTDHPVRVSPACSLKL